MSSFGQFSSLLLDSAVRMTVAGAPGKTFGTHRPKDLVFDRWWITLLQIKQRLPPTKQAVFFTGQRASGASSSSGCAGCATWPTPPNSPLSTSPTRTSS